MPIRIESMEARRLLALVTWDGGGDNATWSDAGNWAGDVVPTAGDDVVINSSGPVVKLPTDLSLNTLTITNRSMTTLFGSATTLTIDSELRIRAGAAVTADAIFATLELRGEGKVEVESDGTLRTDHSQQYMGKMLSRLPITNRGTVFVNGGSNFAGGITNHGTLTLHGFGEIYGEIVNETDGMITCFRTSYSPNSANGPDIDIGLSRSDAGVITPAPFINRGTVRNDYYSLQTELSYELGGANWPGAGLTVFVDATPTLGGSWATWRTALKFAKYATTAGNAEVEVDPSFTFTFGTLLFQNVNASVSGLAANTGLKLFGSSQIMLTAPSTKLALLRVQDSAAVQLGTGSRQLHVQDLERFGSATIEIGDGLLLHGNHPGYMRSWAAGSPSTTPLFAGSVTGNIGGSEVTIEPNGSRHAVGYTTGTGLASHYPTHSFRGESFDDNDFVFFTTLRGDANFDRQVNFDDLLVVVQHYGQATTRGFADGNFAGNVIGAAAPRAATAQVDFDDLLLLAQNYGTPFAKGADNTLPGFQRNQKSRAAVRQIDVVNE